MERDVTLQEGDVVLRINQQPAEGLTLKDARKLLDAARERLSLTVRRDPVPAGLLEKGGERRREWGMFPGCLVGSLDLIVS